MNFDISLEEAYQKYLDLYLYDIKGMPEYYRHADQKLFSDFYKDVDCSEIYFKLMESRSYGSPDCDSNCSRLYRPCLEKGETVTVIDPIRLEIISKYKRMGLNFKRNSSTTNMASQKAVEVLHSDETGLYYFGLEDYVGLAGKKYTCNMYYYPDSPFFEVGINYPFLLVPEQNVVCRGKEIDVADEDVAIFANKIYKEGLPHVFDVLKNGGSIEITDEDRQHYQFSEEFIEPEIEVLDLDSPVDTDGIDSLKFQQFKAEKELREERQRELRTMISAENERKENWFNSPENPTNKRIEELNQMRKKIQGLDNLYNIDSSILTDEQIEYLEKGKIFFDMFEKAESEEHEIDSGMSDEMRYWYQEHYTNEEGRRK